MATGKISRPALPLEEEKTLLGLTSLNHTIKNIAGNSSVTITGPSTVTMGLLVTAGPNNSARGLYIIGSNASGTFFHTDVVPASGVTVSHSGNVMTIANNTSSYIYVSFLQMRGAKST